MMKLKLVIPIHVKMMENVFQTEISIDVNALDILLAGKIQSIKITLLKRTVSKKNFCCLDFAVSICVKWNRVYLENVNYQQQDLK